ncbi:hypothetical protein H4582DRAFT_2069312 [Lactarius indigo]|nr:hypothetical protein H4582DRAFT_2069312 [Lactarius indigo]
MPVPVQSLNLSSLVAEYSQPRIVSTDVVKVAAPLVRLASFSGCFPLDQCTPQFLQLFGPLFNWALYGVLCVQIYVYSCNFPDDKRSVQFLAYFVFLLETVQTALTGADIYHWFVDGFGDVERLAHSHFSSINSPIMRAIISPIVQGYFCYRIWVLNKRLSWICWVITVIAVTQAAAGMWLGVESYIVGRYAIPKTALWSIPSALADILIAVAMTLLLRSASGKFSNFVLIRVVRLTIETNTLTASLAITTLVLYAAFPVSWTEISYDPSSDAITLFPGSAKRTKVIGKVYSNTLLVSLNNRIYFREHKPPGHGDSAYLTVSNRVRATALSSGSPCFAIPESQSRTSRGDNPQLCTISLTVGLDEGKGETIRRSPSLPPSASR